MMVVNMEVGMCHRPVGLNLYVASGITKMGITELTVAVWPVVAHHAGLPGCCDLLADAQPLAAENNRYDWLAVFANGAQLQPGSSLWAYASVSNPHVAPQPLCPPRR